MTNFQFIPVTPHPMLRPFMTKMWVFESEGRMPELDKKLIVPNANFKLAFGYRKGIVSRIGDKSFTLDENEIRLSGIIDSPVILIVRMTRRQAPSVSNSTHLGRIDFFIYRTLTSKIKS